MGHKLRVELDLTDEQYETLMTEMRRSRQEVKAVLEELIDEFHIKQMQFTPPLSRQLSDRELAEYLYDEDIIDRIPTGRIYSEEEEAERKRLADLFGQGGGKLASEMVIEDRGPY